MCCITVCLSVCVCEIARVFENRSIGEYWKVGVSRTRERESLRINKKLNSVYVRVCVRCVCVHGMCVCVWDVFVRVRCVCVCVCVWDVFVCVFCVWDVFVSVRRNTKQNKKWGWGEWCQRDPSEMNVSPFIKRTAVGRETASRGASVIILTRSVSTWTH